MGEKLYYNHLYDESTDGYIHVAEIRGGTVKVYPTNRDGIREVVEEFEGKEDIYITPNTMYIPKRKSSNVRQFRALFQDMDIVQLGFEKAETVYMIWGLYYEGKIPKPTMIIDSGRGIHVYWRIENAPYGAWNTWQELQDYLYYQLKHIGADKKATDSARVLRLPNTINSKNNSDCKVLYIDEDTTYSMYDLREEYLNYKPKSTQLKFHEAKTGTSTKVIPNKFFNSYSLHLARIDDVETLCKLRNYDIKGNRNAILHCYAYWKGITIRDEDSLREDVYSLNSAFIEPLKATEVDAILRCVPKAIDKFIAYEQGLRSGEVKRVTKGMRDKGGYWYKNETLIEIFDITVEEGRQLKTIISTEEKYYRNNKRRKESRRNENGLTNKQQELKDLRKQIFELREKRFTTKEIAKKLGKSESAIKRIK